ncbi:MAG TPA: tRNA (5-methylaminomethyl-2-thiouridylate)-methyltransferase [Spirochaetota bacterium]|nr:tRNA (5-methylaminomethyl-2-thiouridylate)-methyltransferase [Spirochaetota bacterium]HOM39100.1 tRNA (5-methylaminomethyl-2-thiouridylate)-methyltransferase [Spirochaetota bacterium]HPQ49593.1 tRNA (5-methylaminomethyl-2-thiouridylate)-methyltransferase [Spirochaetota bacterium]
MKCIALFSGGLDSLLAIKVIEEQGIEVIPVSFNSYFFGINEYNLEKSFGINVKVIDISKEHLDIVYNPVYGYGKNINPCIDCHLLMIKKAGSLLNEYGASFLITGEVLGQRPMSQNRRAIDILDKASGLKGLILRPLTAKNLDITIPEKEGWVNRDKLFDIKGRERKIQFELIKRYDIKYYSKPGGGCILTMPSFSNRIKFLKEESIQNPYILKSIKYGRFLRFGKGKYAVVSRNEKESKKLKAIDKYDLFLEPYDKPGPNIIYFGDVDENIVDICKHIFLHYAKVDEANVYINGILEFIKNRKKYNLKSYII